jgi:hypothetical protein
LCRAAASAATAAKKRVALQHVTIFGDSRALLYGELAQPDAIAPRTFSVVAGPGE